MAKSKSIFYSLRAVLKQGLPYEFQRGWSLLKFSIHFNQTGEILWNGSGYPSTEMQKLCTTLGPEWDVSYNNRNITISPVTHG